MLSMPSGTIMFKVNGEWTNCGISDGETKESIIKKNNRIWHLPIGTECRYAYCGTTIEFTIDEFTEEKVNNKRPTWRLRH